MVEILRDANSAPLRMTRCGKAGEWGWRGEGLVERNSRSLTAVRRRRDRVRDDR